MILAAIQRDYNTLIITSGVMFVCSFLAVLAGYKPIRQLILRQEEQFDIVLRHKLLIDLSPRAATILSALTAAGLAAIGVLLTGSGIGLVIGVGIGVFIPALTLKLLRRRRMKKLETQLVDGIQTLASGVRAGLNLIQAMQLLARDGPIPIRQEFAHLLREYEFGVPLEEAMRNAANRIASTNYRLLFSALHTHRERGGNLGETLDRISQSVREIQRLEKRVEALTAQGRATARALALTPFIVLAILYFLVDAEGVKRLFEDNLGKLILFVVALLNILGFLWIKKIVSIDI